MLKHGVQKKGSELPPASKRAHTHTCTIFFLFSPVIVYWGSFMAQTTLGIVFPSGLLAFMDGPIIDQNITGIVLGQRCSERVFSLSFPHGARGTGAMGDAFYLMAFEFQSYVWSSEVMVLEMGWEYGSHLPAWVKCSGVWRKHKTKKIQMGDLIVLCYYPVYLLYLYSS